MSKMWYLNEEKKKGKAKMGEILQSFPFLKNESDLKREKVLS